MQIEEDLFFRLIVLKKLGAWVSREKWHIKFRFAFI
jgi:hypothetical protein